MAEPVAQPSRVLSLSGFSTTKIIPRISRPRGEHRARGAEENIEGVRPDVEIPRLTHENFKRPEGRDPVAAALASVVAMSRRSSLLLREGHPNPAIRKLAQAKVKARTRRKGDETMIGPILGTRERSLEYLMANALRQPTCWISSPTGYPENLHRRRRLLCAWYESPVHAACLLNQYAPSLPCPMVWRSRPGT